jgi:hypothetical protein
MDGSQMLGFNRTNNRLETGSKKEYGKKKIVKHLGAGFSRLFASAAGWQFPPIILLANKTERFRQSLDVCVPNAA